jgi:Ion channel
MTGEPVAAALGMVRGREERWARFAGRIANAFGLVLLLVVATYVAASLTRYSGWSAVLVTALACGSGAVALASSGVRTVVARAAAAVAIACVLLAAIAAIADRSGFLAAASLAQMLLLAVAAGAVLRTVVGESRVGFRTILGAISVYMIFGLLFTSLYAAIDRLQSGQFFISEGGGSHTGNFIFFSFTTLTTTGYGNLVPAAQPGKMFAGLEMLLGQIFLVTLIAGLVSLWRPSRRRGAGPEPDA